MALGFVAIIALIVFLLVVGTGMFIMLLGGKDKSTGSKVGIVIVVVCGLFFLVCMGAPLMFFRFARTHEEPAGLRRYPQVEEIAIPNLPEEQLAKPPQQKQFGEIPVHLKEKKDAVPTETNNKSIITKENK